MLNKKTSFSLLLEGGMASQLFQLCAGLTIVLARNFQEMELNYSIVESRRQHEGDLRQLDFGMLSSYFMHATLGLRSNLLQRVEAILSRRRAFAECRVKTSTEDITYVSSQNRYVSNVEQQFNHRKLSGTFVSCYYPNQIERLLQIKLRNELKVANPSKEFGRYMDLFDRERPLIVHVRKGDYLSKRDKFGLLSDNWFVGATVQALESVSSLNSIVLVTDGISECSALVKKLSSLDLEVSILSHEFNSAETLFLMARGGAHVISNSGFGWWSSFLSNSSLLTIFPESWTKEVKLQPPCLIPDSGNWLPKHSEWIEADDLEAP
jgi:hypothetical protein